MHNIVTHVMTTDGVIVVTHAVKAADGKQEVILILTLDIDAAGTLSRSLRSAIEMLTAQHANSLPDKTYEPKAGRTNA